MPRNVLAAGCLFALLAWLGGGSVARAEEQRPLNFENDLVPIFSKYGCNSSGCHGKAEGQNGFKLSVFGFDPAADYQALTREGRGRRVFPAAPEKSLLLLKISGGLPHGGGVRIDAQRPEFTLLRRWIAEGLPVGSPSDPQVAKIEISPREETLAIGQTVQLRVTATYTDGRRADVTRLAKFQTNNEGLATVDDDGLAAIGHTPGVAALMASFMGAVDTVHTLIPRVEKVQPYPPVVPFNFIDELVYRRLQQLQMVPAELGDDAEFLRRVHLDLIGGLPTAEEARRFLADSSPQKRARLVEALLARPEFADFWALHWADLLRVDRQALGPKSAFEEYQWIRQSLLVGKPLDQLARDIISAEGPLAESPQGNLFRAAPLPGQAASMISQVFLGVRIECAQCHHHPFDRWTQNDFLGMAAYFAPLQRKETPRGVVLFAEGESALPHPRTHEKVLAHPLGQAAITATPPGDTSQGDKRRELAAWLTAPENPWFARNLANRVWARMLGRGLVEPVDDFRATNPPSNPLLLDALAAELVKQKFDLRGLIRVIAASRTYQHSSHSHPTNQLDEQNYSRALFKRLDAEVLLDAVSQTTGVAEKFAGAPAGTRAIQLWDSQVDHDFLRLFGRPMRQSVCECERVVEPSVGQVLHLLNSQRVQEKLSSEQGFIARLAQREPDNGRAIDELYLTLFSRHPAEGEQKIAAAHLQRGADSAARRLALEDLAWTMLNSLEFVFNH